MGTAIKHTVPDGVKPSFVIFDIRATYGYSYDKSARMSKITNDGLTPSGTVCFIAVPIWQQWASKGYSQLWSAGCVSVSTDNLRRTFVRSFVLLPRGTVCPIHSKTLLCHCLAFRTTLRQ